MPLIPTFRIMNEECVVEDESMVSPEVTPEKVLGWYKNMLTGESVGDLYLGSARTALTSLRLVHIMDGIMFEAQRHGRVSFYMVCAVT